VLCYFVVTYTPLEQLRWNIHANEAHKNNKNNNTIQKKSQKEISANKIKSTVLKEMYFNVNNKNEITLEYFN
jgi:hypothetical protein